MIGWLGIVVFAAERTKIADCEPPSARSVESLLAPCLEHQRQASAESSR
jgi:hypothetical protein